jgi:S-adenosylmethionine synthetase
MNRRILTAESVCNGHPDKLCDQISDAVLDECLRHDPKSRVACEALATKDLIVIGGEITTKAKLDYRAIVKTVADKAGCYLDGTPIYVAVHEQSPDICRAVDGDNGENEQTAGDQGVMVGYATDETLSLMPIEYEYARRVTQALEECRTKGTITGIKSDGKSQISAEFLDGKFSRFTKVVVSVQHDANKPIGTLKNEIFSRVIIPIFGEFDLSDTEILINPSGRFVLGGIGADTGLTGRKIVADAYGPRVPVGGGAFSGKDPSKVDRSGAYFARYVAKNIVAAGLATECQVQIAYAIGKAEPMAVNLDTFNSSNIPNEVLLAAVRKVFDFRPASIIKQLDLLNPVYTDTASDGHFGRDGFSWERTDKVSELKAAVA